jgi:general secretion pathway protein K
VSLQRNYSEFITTGNLYDLQGRFNLNNLSKREYYPMFLHLLENALPDMSANERESIAFATRQWISPYKPGRGNDELVTYYLKEKPPYQQSNQPMQSISEFRLIAGVNASTYQRLSKFITVLPEVTPINLFSAPKTVLKSLGNGLNDAQLNELLEARSTKSDDKKDDFSALLQKFAIRNETITLESEYFMSQGMVVHDDLSLINFTILKRSKDKKGAVSVNLISENLNSL